MRDVGPCLKIGLVGDIVLEFIKVLELTAVLPSIIVLDLLKVSQFMEMLQFPVVPDLMDRAMVRVLASLDAFIIIFRRITDDRVRCSRNQQ